MQTVLLAVLLAVCCIGCGNGDGVSPQPDPDMEPDKTARLLGTWTTQGEDPDLGGAVQVRMELRAMGVLRVTVTPASGAALSFPGTWSVPAPDRLRLRGVWFEPDGDVEVRCEILNEQLLLTAPDGSQQTWVRQPPA